MTMIYVSNTKGTEEHVYTGESFEELLRLAEGVARRSDTGFAYLQHAKTFKVLAVVNLRKGYGEPFITH
jgi:hypothetical protein